MYINSTTNNDILEVNKRSKNKETNSSDAFEKELSKSTNENEENEVTRSSKELVEDIISLIKTGFTKEELEEIERLKEAILKKFNDEEENPTKNGITEIKDLLAQLERMVQEMKKQVLGVVIEEADSTNNINSKKDNSSSNNQHPSLNSGILQELKEKFSNINDDIKELEKIQKQTKNVATSQDELYLLEQLKNS